VGCFFVLSPFGLTGPPLLTLDSCSFSWGS
jgi:hypothetical protein